MKRLHVHVAVDDLAASIRFYSTLFAAAPSVAKPDYAKWMLSDPRVNFAISTHGAGQPNSNGAGLDHLGIQVEDAAELGAVYDRLKRAEAPVLEEGAATCCYAKSEKAWIRDPSGIAWETFLTTGESTVYGESADLTALAPSAEPMATACGCAPDPAPAAVETVAACCGPRP